MTRSMLRAGLIAGALCAAVALTGCQAASNIGSFISSAANADVPAPLVLVAGNAFDAVEATATNYLNLKRCGTAPCRSPKATAVIVPAIRSGRVARNNLEQFLNDHPGALGPKGEYDALVAATSTLKSAFAQYGIQ